jgi:methylated-DNA-[protein]-cysteine S-methyltransferase
MNMHATIPTPIGDLTASFDDDGALTALDLPGRGPAEATTPGAADAEGEAVARVAAQVAEYFAGERTAFDLTLRPTGTLFERRVWDELARIPYGTTTTYAELAVRIGHPGSARAVGRANGRNPIAIVVPCHRVIGSNGSLTGYAGGLELKASLLALEADAAAAATSASPAAVRR